MKTEKYPVSQKLLHEINMLLLNADPIFDKQDKVVWQIPDDVMKYVVSLWETEIEDDWIQNPDSLLDEDMEIDNDFGYKGEGAW